MNKSVLRHPVPADLGQGGTMCLTPPQKPASWTLPERVL